MAAKVFTTLLLMGLSCLIMCRRRTAMESTLLKVNFKEAVEIRNDWDCSLPLDLLELGVEDGEEDKDARLLAAARAAVRRYLESDNWSRRISNACWAIATHKDNDLVKEFRKVGLYAPLRDFVEHLHYFEVVRKIMSERGEEVSVLGLQRSNVHDVDKLHPIMLAAYVEKYHNRTRTDLLERCVEHHVSINPHHQGNPLWSNGYCSIYNTFRNNCLHCQRLRHAALREMVCDKVARRLQRILGGSVSEDMWNVERKFFEGLPKTWIKEAYNLLERLKKHR